MLLLYSPLPRPLLALHPQMRYPHTHASNLRHIAPAPLAMVCRRAPPSFPRPRLPASPREGVRRRGRPSERVLLSLLPFNSCSSPLKRRVHGEDTRRHPERAKQAPKHAAHHVIKHALEEVLARRTAACSLSPARRMPRHAAGGVAAIVGLLVRVDLHGGLALAVAVWVWVGNACL